MRASVIVVAHAGFHHLEDSIGSLEGGIAAGDFEVILVDNASPDRCGDAAAERWPGLHVIRTNRNLGFAGGVSVAAGRAFGDVLILLNDDAAAEPEAPGAGAGAAADVADFEGHGTGHRGLSLLDGQGVGQAKLLIVNLAQQQRLRIQLAAGHVANEIVQRVDQVRFRRDDHLFAWHQD